MYTPVPLDRNDSAQRIVSILNKGEVAKSREIVPNINTLARQCRNRGAAVIWVVHANARLPNGRSDWQLFSDMIVHGDVRERTLEANSPGNQKLWEGLEQDHDRDITCIKNRYSALVPGSSSLERILRSLDIDTLFVAGTKTNVCCESTARDAVSMRLLKARKISTRGATDS